ncbi:3-(3-hydroxyphenyl)propionate hydroxylase [Mycobacteroides abscessus subsp. bolletii]|uniref:bifunctional 3-(3-hydroxy-phenyl)propionate/3-hydroxycinnamic acid hydroxylase MhpA n=1 Tax=Mycobacteroides abscessus TaxID=36809 RepID=UPI0009A560FF|nr:bifunctional 3-(3-hydroxy-phenyl)propionate/3-hydroxycinnamic acid hydroxylase [Mycobacteroides abscessus]SKG75599.1 3-(3-hydroxyphenyl)propionate hydroxylase [Mycobacteroides abscessus subsp. bolletii]SKH25670.1 3-(3-hydroxyphenyl)propionate hydroxylase [Mycobacteroides abscessus subsp. bolletii]
MDEIFDVAIVGYGPTGMVAASMLGQFGHRVVVCERWPSLYGLPRFTHIDDETARAIQKSSNVDEALSDSVPTEYIWVNGADEELLCIPAAAEGRMGYSTHLSMYQPDVENAIDRRIRTLPNVEVLQGWAVTTLRQDGEGVDLILRPWQGREESSVERGVRARYVIAADGSNSDVRQLLGIDRDDFGFNERWLNVDTEWLRPAPAEFRTSKQYCDPARGHMYMLIGERRQRFEFALLDNETREDFEKSETAWNLIARAHQLGPGDVKIIRQIVYTFESRIARRWRDSRVFLAGDAAHTMPPYLGQGACSGIRDALNLTWKLDLVLRSLCSENMLDSYEVERRPHVTAIMHMAIGLGAIANTHDFEAAARRDAAFRSGDAPPPPLLPSLSGGVIREQSDNGVGQGPGGLVPQSRVSIDGRMGRLDDLAGYGFVLIADTDISKDLSSQQVQFLKDLGCTVLRVGHDLVDEEGLLEDYLRELNAVAYIARPDFVLFGAAATHEEVTELVDDLRNALAWTPTNSTVGL